MIIAQKFEYSNSVILRHELNLAQHTKERRRSRPMDQGLHVAHEALPIHRHWFVDIALYNNLLLLTAP